MYSSMSEEYDIFSATAVIGQMQKDGLVPEKMP